MSSENEYVTASSGNIFADLGLDDADELYAKAELALHIKRIVKQRGLTQTQAGKMLGVAQPEVSLLMRGQLDQFSTERLMHLLMKCERDIEIVVKRRPRTRKHSKLSVRAA